CHELTLMVNAGERLKPQIFAHVGANIALCSCILGRLRLVTRVLPLEPDRLSFTRLQANIELNDLQTIVDARDVGAGARCGTMAFLPAGSANGGVSKIGPTEEGSYDVTVAALDDLLDTEGSTIAIKIDVEGYELEVLAGAERLFGCNAGIAQIEGHGDERAAE